MAKLHERVRRQRAERDQREAPVVGPDQHGGDHNHLQRGRQDRVERPVEQIGDRAAAALDVAGDAASAPREMELQAQPVQMAEHLQRDLPRSSRHHAGEHDLADLGEERDADARAAVRDQQRDRQRPHAGLETEVVDDLLERDRQQHIGELGAKDQSESEDDAAEIGTQVGQQLSDHCKIAPAPPSSEATDPSSTAVAFSGRGFGSGSIICSAFGLVPWQGSSFTIYEATARRDSVLTMEGPIHVSERSPLPNLPRTPSRDLADFATPSIHPFSVTGNHRRKRWARRGSVPRKIDHRSHHARALRPLGVEALLSWLRVRPISVDAIGARAQACPYFRRI